MKGNPKSKHQSMKKDYVQVRVEGKGMIGRAGQRIPSKHSNEAHIPLSEWKAWSNWFAP